MRISIDWSPGTLSGWGVYGLNLVLQWRMDDEVELSFPPSEIVIDPLRAQMVYYPLQWKPDEADVFLHALGNEVLPECNTPIDRTIGVIFFEEPLSNDAVDRAKRYPMIIAGSTWNHQQLVDAGINARLVFQGVDRSLFHPAPAMGVFNGSFAIFSGGKAEWRKGQDIVLEAFREFSERHDDAFLVTAWQSPWDPASFNGGSTFPATRFWNPGKGINVLAWANSVGINPDKVIDIGMTHNTLMPMVLRECDCGIFPSRCEGGTNLPAMEALACGIPVAVSHNTGNLDLPTLHMEATPESVLEMMETMYSGGWNSGIRGFKWSTTARLLKEHCRELMGVFKNAA